MSSASTSRRRSASLRKRLADRPRPHITYPLLVDVDELQAAQQRLEQARQEWRQLVLRGEDATQAQAAVDEAQAAVDGCYAQIVLRALPPEQYEELIAAHPPTEAQRAAGEIWNVDSFRPALLAGCADGDMTAEDWAAFLAERCSQGERQELWVAALAVNEQARVAEPMVLPKGLTTTRN